MTTIPFLPYGKPSLEDDDRAAVAEALCSDMLTTGPRVPAFESDLCAALGSAEAVAVSNGTAALHLTARALDLGPGKCAIVPSMTFVATANCVDYTGADVVFADVDPTTGLITPDTVADAIARAPVPPSALYVVHLNGQSADMIGLSALARQHGMALIEDACHAIGGLQKTATDPAKIGACAVSDMAVFSFHPVKTITTLEGGAITTNDADLARRMRDDRHHGLVRDPAHFENREDAFAPSGDPNPWYSEMPHPGYNYRLTDVQCALGSSQLRKLGRFVERRRALVARYRALISENDLPLTMLNDLGQPETSWHLFPVFIDFDALGRDRASVMRALAEKGIGSQVHYFPVHRQPYYRRQQPGLSLPGADRYYAQCLSLPLYPTLTEVDLCRVVSALNAVLG